ncbi:hypothetical protein [Archangium lansingense]|uniref:Uncharacterized protein n=1 Tax=Archangium lansingense TaxID=2995310 RepID=A0ABT4AIS8_9BACT|nr:hypothetical protein [Archangium lansinium]MCY1080767.1 hypothetical protein [Archangium lansinium]
METLLAFFLVQIAVSGGQPYDPAPGVWNDKSEARNLDCSRVSQQRAHELHPGEIPAPLARLANQESEALICTRLIMRNGERPERDEVILASLRKSVGEIAEVASALGPGKLTWHVDAFYPQPEVAAKISVAARIELAEQGRRVSDKVPVLAAGDIAVLGRMAPKEAYPLACKRYFAQRALGENDAFLGIMLIDARETQLHAGLCLNGEWRWLR